MIKMQHLFVHTLFSKSNLLELKIVEKGFCASLREEFFWRRG